MVRWRVLLGCFVGMAVSVGPIFWLALGLFLQPMTTEFGWSRTEFAAVFSIASIANALALPAAGYFVDRFGPPRVIFAGFSLMCLCYACFSLVGSYPAFVALGCAVAVAGCLASYPAYLGLPPRWFDRNLGFALAIASSGVGAGAALFPYLINFNLQANGWRTTFVIVAAIAFTVALVNCLIFIRDNKGPVPAAEQLPIKQDAPRIDVPYADAIRSSDFWMFSIAFGLIFLVTIGLNFHFAALVRDRGGSPTEAASAVAALGVASLLARFCTGALLDRFPVRYVALPFFVGQALGCLLLLQGDPRWTIPGAILLGAAQGAELDMMPYVIARRFGRMAYSRIYGTSYAILQLGQIASPIILAGIFDRTGSYVTGLMLYPFLSLLAVLLVWFAKVAPREPMAAPAAGPLPAPAGAKPN